MKLMSSASSIGTLTSEDSDLEGKSFGIHLRTTDSKNSSKTDLEKLSNKNEGEEEEAEIALEVDELIPEIEG
jgi:hypothetical protein